LLSQGRDGTPPDDTDALRERLDLAGYQVIGVRDTAQGEVWTLAPHRSQVEFERVGCDELRRFLAHV
jgi:hypothetical protein